MDTERAIYFPEFFGDDLNHLNKLREYLIIRCRVLEDLSEEDRKQMDLLHAYFSDNTKPMKFNPFEPENILSVSEMQFEDMVATMEDQGVSTAKKLTEYEFYTRIKFYQKKFKAMSGK